MIVFSDLFFSPADADERRALHEMFWNPADSHLAFSADIDSDDTFRIVRVNLKFYSLVEYL